MLTDIEIAKQADIKPISDIAEKLGISADELEFYGKYKAKLPLSLLKKYENKEDGKLILVTAINPTPAGEGKTTVNGRSRRSDEPHRQKSRNSLA